MAARTSAASLSPILSLRLQRPLARVFQGGVLPGAPKARSKGLMEVLWL